MHWGKSTGLRWQSGMLVVRAVAEPRGYLMLKGTGVVMRVGAMSGP